MNKYLFVLPLAWLLLLAACKPCTDPTNPECENYCDDPSSPECFNYDPCLDKASVSAAFEIAEVVGYVNYDTIIYVPTDTSLEKNFVRFRAEQEADSYEWRIGSDTRVFTTREVSLFFQGPTQLSITLILKRSPATECFPDDDGVDTVSRRLVVVPREESALIGKFEGATDQNPEERYVVEFFRYAYPQTPTIFQEVRLTGIHPGCNNVLEQVDAFSGHYGYRVFAFSGRGGFLEGGCFARDGVARLNAANDSVVIQFRKVENQFPYGLIDETLFFRGARITD